MGCGASSARAHEASGPASTVPAEAATRPLVGAPPLATAAAPSAASAQPAPKAIPAAPAPAPAGGMSAAAAAERMGGGPAPAVNGFANGGTSQRMPLDPLPPAAATPNLPTEPPPWTSNPVTLEVIPSADMDVDAQSLTNVLVRVHSPQVAERVPSVLCCVLDISGSMGAEAKITTAGGESEKHGLSLLDVAKHGVRTIINTLTDQDQLSIVTFNHQAAVPLGPTVMDEAGKKIAERVLDALVPRGGTNLWAGLEQGLEALRNHSLIGSLGHIMLLSDGESNHREVIMPNLLAYQETYRRLPGTISTFGFGYRIDSGLLVRLANTGDGAFAFIPDAGFIGTVFVNLVSNLLITFAREVTLLLEPQENSEIIQVLGGHKMTPNENGTVTVRMGMLQYQQSRDLVLTMNTRAGGAYLRASGSYEPLERSGMPQLALSGVVGPAKGQMGEVDGQVMRSKIVDVISACWEKGSLNRTRSMVLPGDVDTRRLSMGSVSSASAVQPGGIQRGSQSSNPDMSRSSASGSSAPGMVHANTSPAIGDSGRSSIGKSIMNFFSGAPAPAKEEPARLQAVQAPPQVVWRREEAQKYGQEIVQAVLEEIKEVMAKGEPSAFVQALFEDISGQMSEAVSCDEFFTKWGRHYLPSLMFAHRLQQCNNFKDPGVQHYGGQLFEDLRDAADDIFCQLPPPKRTCALPQYGAGSAPASVVDMSAYNNRYGA